jgi:hypothetical protein
MAKTDIKARDAAGILRTVDSGGWSICVGAGSSLPFFPTWQDLVQNLLTTGPRSLTADEAKNLRDSFPPEALISASQVLLGKSDADFRKYLTEKLYATIKSKAGKQWQAVAKCLMARVPGNALASEWASLLQFAASADSSSFGIAELLLDSIEQGTAPNAVLSFNAEPLLFALLNANAVARFRKAKSSKSSDGGNESEVGPGVVDRIEGSTSSARKGRIPYYFCHGFLPLSDVVNGTFSITPPAAMFDSKMVFSEVDYLDLANTVWSWQSSVFTRAAMSDRLVFIGLSLTDPNMRRWLAWIHNQRLHEIQSRNPKVMDSTQHVWIHKSSGSKAIDNWTEAVVSHLGIRLVWLDDWREVGSTLRRMLNL